MLDLSGKRCVITGAGRGLGQAFSVSFAALGAEIVATARSAEALEETARLVEEAGGQRPETVVMDLADAKSTAQAAEEIAQGPVDILINNGAGWLEGDLTDVTPVEIEATVASAVSGTAAVLRGVWRSLKRTSGVVITIVSTCGLDRTGIDHASPVFHAAKRGQAGLMESCRPALRRDGIRSIALFPPDLDDDSDGSEKSPIGGGDVIDCALFALSRRRTLTLSDIVMRRMDQDSPYA